MVLSEIKKKKNKKLEKEKKFVVLISSPPSTVFFLFSFLLFQTDFPLIYYFVRKRDRKPKDICTCRLFLYDRNQVIPASVLKKEA